MVSLLQWKKKQKNILWFALCVGVAWVAVVCHTWGMWSSTSFCHTLSYFPNPSCKASNHNAYIRKDNAFAIESHWSWYISKYRISFVRTVHVQYLKELKTRIVLHFIFGQTISLRRERQLIFGLRSLLISQWSTCIINFRILKKEVVLNFSSTNAH